MTLPSSFRKQQNVKIERIITQKYTNVKFIVLYYHILKYFNNLSQHYECIFILQYFIFIKNRKEFICKDKQFFLNGTKKRAAAEAAALKVLLI